MNYNSSRERRRKDRIWLVIEWIWTAFVIGFSLFVIVMIVR